MESHSRWGKLMRGTLGQWAVAVADDLVLEPATTTVVECYCSSGGMVVGSPEKVAAQTGTKKGDIGLAEKMARKV